MRKLIPMMLASLLYPAVGYPLGLGEIRLHSALNQPLSAEIDLLSVSAEDASSVTAGLASSEVFAQLGLDRNAALLLVQFEVKQRPDGSYYVKASSRQPIRETYLDFLLEVNWRSGRVLREYTVLLDPPELMKQPPVAVQPPAPEIAAPSAPVTAPAPAVPSVAVQAKEPGQTPQAAPENAEQPAVAEPAATPAQPEAAPAPVATGAPAKSGIITYGPVRRNETLGNIAKRVRPDDSATLQQVMIALVRANPHAFYGRNVNRLKAGHVLRLDPAQIAAISREEAAREIALQGREWQDFKQRAAAQASSRAPSGSTDTAGGTSVASAKKEEPRLKLVTPENAGQADKDQAAAPGTGSKDADALRNELMIANETTEAQQQENDELRKRMQELEGQLASMQRLLSLKDNDLAALQRQAAQAGEPTKATPKDAMVQQPPAAVAPAQPQQAAPAAAPTAGAPEAAAAPAPVAPAAQPAKPRPAAPVPAPTPVPMEEPSFFAGNELLMGLGGFFALLLAAMGYVVIRRRQSGASFQESILMGGSPSMLKAKQAEKKTSEETSFFSDFAVSGMGDIHAEDSEVDPLTEADVYMAYQRFQQAEELLREAMKHNDRPELHVKLLEVYHATRDKAAFEAEAVQVNDMLKGQGPLWDKVLVLGHDLLPQHALFAQAPEKPVTADATHADARLDNEVLDIGLDLDALAEEMESGAQAAGEFNLDLGVDFSDLEDHGKGANKAPEPAPSAAIETVAPAAQPAAKPAVAAAPAKEEGLEFDLGDLSLHLDEEAPVNAARPAPTPAPAAAAPALANESSELDLSDLDLGALELNEAATAAEPSLEIGDEPIEEPSEDLSAHGALAGGADSSELDLGDFDLNSLNLDQGAEAEAPPAASLGEGLDLADLEDLNLEAELPGNKEDDALFSDLDETGTKLDLARAYVEMGDAEGARSILDEVIQEGNPQQKQQAQELLHQLA